MKIAVVGCGAVGSFYGAKLARAGHEVHFLLRSDYEKVRRSGVSIESPEGNFSVRPRCANAPEDIGVCDLVVIALKTTANHEFGRLLPALTGSATLLVTLQNGLGNEEALAQLFGVERVLGGLCFVCLNRVAPGCIRHIDHGDVVLGEVSGPALERTHALANLLQEAAIRCRVSEHLARSRWEKLCWNVPFNGLGVAAAAGHEALLVGRWELEGGLRPCLTTDQLLAEPHWESLVRELMWEVVNAAGRLGCELPETLPESMIQRTRSMGPYKASTLLDFECRRALEVDSIFLEPLKKAKAAGSETPRLEALCGVLRGLNAALLEGRI